MTPADIRKMAVCLPFADARAGLQETQAALIALADVVEVLGPRHCNNSDCKVLLCLALARVEAL